MNLKIEVSEIQPKYNDRPTIKVLKAVKVKPDEVLVMYHDSIDKTFSVELLRKTNVSGIAYNLTKDLASHWFDITIQLKN